MSASAATPQEGFRFRNLGFGLGFNFFVGGAGGGGGGGGGILRLRVKRYEIMVQGGLGYRCRVVSLVGGWAVGLGFEVRMC